MNNKYNDPVVWYDGKKFYGSQEAASMCLADIITLKPLYAAPPKRELLSKLFAEAIVWGMVYGPEIHPAQWDSIRDEQAKAFADRSEVIGGQS